MKENGWAKWSSIAEIVSSVAVLITLLYLAIQTQQNTDAILASTRQDALNSELEQIYKMFDRPHLFTYGSRLASRDGYTDSELQDILVWSIANFRIRENLWFQFKSGVLDAKTWESYLNQFIGDLKNDPFTRESWIIFYDAFDPMFVSDINHQLAE